MKLLVGIIVFFISWLILLLIIICCLASFASSQINEEINKRKCLNSIYKTDDYRAINNVLYCRSSDNSYQKLTKPKVRSSHMDEHFKN